MNAEQEPYRQLPGGLDKLRRLVRKARMVKHHLKLRSKLSVGENVNLGPRARLAPPSHIRLGNNVATGSDLDVTTNLEVGDDVLISSHVSFIGNDHRIDDREKSVFWAGRLPDNTVVLGGDNLIGYRVTVVGNVTIGKGCVVGAGAVVTRDLPPYTICAGVPARPLRQRYPDREKDEVIAI